MYSIIHTLAWWLKPNMRLDTRRAKKRALLVRTDSKGQSLETSFQIRDLEGYPEIQVISRNSW